MAIRIDGDNATATPGITGGDADTGLVFGTDEIEAVTGGTTRFTVESNGNVTIEDGNLVVASGHGIDFSATADGTGATNVSELLDDYEEGDWTPGVKQGTVSSSSVGRYIKVGKLCTITAYVVNFSDRTSSDVVEITGLPFTAEVSDSAIGSCMIRYMSNENGNTALHSPVSYIATADTSLRVYQQSVQGNLNYDSLKHEDILNTSSSIRYTVSYRTTT